jgi:nicotinate dehydrogenase subunit A
VLIDGVSQASCNLALWAVQGKAIITVEGLPPALADAFVAVQALQCGYCGSGVLVGAAALLQRQPQPTEADVRSALDGHLCRCGAHNRIVRAVLRAAQGLR